MATEKFKLGVIALAEKLKANTISDAEMIKFFEDNRDEFMASPTFPKIVTREELITAQRNDYFNAGTPPLAYLTCSCGGRDDSCKEDGSGVYSQFYVNELGDTFRYKVQK